MATVHVTISRADDRGDSGAAMPVLTSVPLLAETIASSASSAAGSISAPRADGLFWTIVAKGGDVWVAFGASPTAGSGGGHLVLSGQARDFSVTVSGEKIAVKDA